VDGLHQPEGRDLAQVLHGLAAVTEAAGDAVGHGQPRGDELVADGVPLRSVPQRGQAGEEGGGVRGVVVPPAGGGRLGGGGSGTGGRGVNEPCGTPPERWLGGLARVGRRRDARGVHGGHTDPAGAPPVRSSKLRLPRPQPNKHPCAGQSAGGARVQERGTTAVMHLPPAGRSDTRTSRERRQTMGQPWPPGRRSPMRPAAARATGSSLLRSLTETRTDGPVTSTRTSVTPPPCRMALVVSSDATSSASDRASASQGARPVRHCSDTARSTASRTSPGRHGDVRRTGPPPGGSATGTVVCASRILRLPGSPRSLRPVRAGQMPRTSLFGSPVPGVANLPALIRTHVMRTAQGGTRGT